MFVINDNDKDDDDNEGNPCMGQIRREVVNDDDDDDDDNSSFLPLFSSLSLSSSLSSSV